MPEPKSQTTHRKTGLRRSHQRLKLARRVNTTSPVKVYTTRKQSAKATNVVAKDSPAKPETEKAKTSQPAS